MHLSFSWSRPAGPAGPARPAWPARISDKDFVFQTFLGISSIAQPHIAITSQTVGTAEKELIYATPQAAEEGV
jgi:hypothetical protein